MAKEQMTPMMTQYLKTKEEYEDCILFYRLGDFYEMFFDDAIKASKELEITLTGKDCGLSERAPMCGVPFHSASVISHSHFLQIHAFLCTHHKCSRSHILHLCIFQE